MIRLQVRIISGRYLWRMLGDNNRTVAISASTFDVSDDCLKNLRVTIRAAQSRDPELRKLGVGRWVWVLTGADGVDLVSSMTTFTRRSECVKAIDRFVAVVRAPRAYREV